MNAAFIGLSNVMVLKLCAYTVGTYLSVALRTSYDGLNNLSSVNTDAVDVVSQKYCLPIRATESLATLAPPPPKGQRFFGLKVS